MELHDHPSGNSRQYWENTPNGKISVFIERLWRTVKYEEVYLKDYETPREAMQGLGTFFVRYNEWRQHQALGYQTPAAVYFSSYL